MSLRARGLLALFRDMGRVISSTEAVALVSEGRDAIRSAYRELESLGLISRDRFQTSTGHWVTEYRFTDAWKTDDGFSGALLVGQLEANNLNLADITPNGVISTSSGSPKCPNLEEEEYVQMPWPGFESQKQDEDAPSGAVGRVLDKTQERNAKYKKTRLEAVPEHMRRHERPEQDWTTADIVSEFYDQTRKHAPGAPGQVNGKNLSSWINQRVGEGTPRIAVLKAVRMFFSDPRLIRDPGVGQPFWRRFVAFYPTVHGIVVKDEVRPMSDAEFNEYSERMVRLLDE